MCLLVNSVVMFGFIHILLFNSLHGLGCCCGMVFLCFLFGCWVS